MSKQEQIAMYEKFKTMKLSDLPIQNPTKWRIPNNRYGGYSVWIDCNLTDNIRAAIVGMYNLQQTIYEQVKRYDKVYENDSLSRNEILSYNYLIKDDYKVIKKWMDENDISRDFFFYVKDAFFHSYTSVIKNKNFNAKRVNLDFSSIGDFASTENSQVIRFPDNPAGLDAFYVKEYAKWKVKKLYDELQMCEKSGNFQLINVSIVIVDSSKISLVFYFKSTDTDDPTAIPEE